MTPVLLYCQELLSPVRSRRGSWETSVWMGWVGPRRCVTPSPSYLRPFVDVSCDVHSKSPRNEKKRMTKHKYNQEKYPHSRRHRPDITWDKQIRGFWGGCHRKWISDDLLQFKMTPHLVPDASYLVLILIRFASSVSITTSLSKSWTCNK